MGGFSQTSWGLVYDQLSKRFLFVLLNLASCSNRSTLESQSCNHDILLGWFWISSLAIMPWRICIQSLYNLVWFCVEIDALLRPFIFLYIYIRHARHRRMQDLDMTGWHDLGGGDKRKVCISFCLKSCTSRFHNENCLGGFGIVSFVPGIHLFEFPR